MLSRGVLALALVAGASVGSAPRSLAAQEPLPSPVGYVNDFASVLPPESRARLEELARRVNAATRGDMVIVTLPDLAGRPVEEVPLRLGREWRIGANAVVTEDVPEGATMVGVKARSTLVEAETWAKDFLPYGTPCKEPCEPGSQRIEDLEHEVRALREQVEALLGRESADHPTRRSS